MSRIVAIAGIIAVTVGAILMWNSARGGVSCKGAIPWQDVPDYKTGDTVIFKGTVTAASPRRDFPDALDFGAGTGEFAQISVGRVTVTLADEDPDGFWWYHADDPDSLRRALVGKTACVKGRVSASGRWPVDSWIDRVKFVDNSD